MSSGTGLFLYSSNNTSTTPAMLNFLSQFRIDKASSIAVYLQIANGFVTLIRQGNIRPGFKLPGSRELAQELGLHRKTIVAAYDELEAQSWIDVLPRKGVFVAQKLPDVKPRNFVQDTHQTGYPETTHFAVEKEKIPFPLIFPEANYKYKLVFNDGFPDTRLVPTELIIREYRRFANFHFTTKFLNYGPEHGSENLRVELAKFLAKTRGLNVRPDNILITKGAQMAMYLTAQVLLAKGDCVVVGEPGYFGANDVFLQAGAKLELIPVDKDGIDLNALEAVCKKHKVRLLYVVPHHHHPTTVTLSSERRMQLIELSMKYKFAILEDDYDYDFHYASSPILPLASVDHYGNVIYMGSFCKTIAPAIRIGFMIAPTNLIEQVTRLRRLIDRQGEQLLEEAMANLLKSGDIGRHLKKTNKLYRERRDLLCELLTNELSEHVHFQKPDGGFAVWTTLSPHLNLAKVAQKSAELGLWINNGSRYYHNKRTTGNSTRLGFASLNQKEMEEAVDILKTAIHSFI